MANTAKSVAIGVDRLHECLTPSITDSTEWSRSRNSVGTCEKSTRAV
jgi:hypothetical protein